MIAYCIVVYVYLSGAIMTAALIAVWVRHNRPDVKDTARTHCIIIAAIVIWPLIPIILIWMTWRDWGTEINIK